MGNTKTQSVYAINHKAAITEKQVRRAINLLLAGRLPKPPRKRLFWREYYNEDGSQKTASIQAI